MASNFTEYYVQLINSRTGRPVDDDAGIYNVLTAGDPAEVTIYSDDVGTSLANPATMSNGIIRFFTSDTVTSVDLSILTNNGASYFIEALTPSQHRREVDPESDDYTLILPWTFSGASETVVDTGFDLLAMMAVRDVFLHVTTAGLASAGVILDVGTSTDNDGFLDGINAETTGFKVLSEVSASNAGLGDLLVLAATNGGDVGRKLHMRANATSGAQIIYTNTTSSGTTGAGYIYMRYHRFRTAGN